VRQAVAAARAAGFTEARLVTLLRRRVGLMGGGRFFDLLFEGRADTVVSAIRAAATMAEGSEPLKGEACFALASH